jgi:hypothetical protein
MPGGMSWHDYDETLIERGCAILDLGSLTSWKGELDAMNAEKLGRPYEFPNSYISFLAFLKVGFDITYRTVEGPAGRSPSTSGSSRRCTTRKFITQKAEASPKVMLYNKFLSIRP